tara:strand:+ start:486 stop:749 length:264 start_codon:yes stop_codon:yes gene_type:complete
MKKALLLLLLIPFIGCQETRCIAGDCDNGYGVYIFPSTDLGIGRMWKNGGKYVGGYKKGLFHGQGTYNYADGTCNSGLFRNHEFIVE